jgi:hypothetical protein
MRDLTRKGKESQPLGHFSKLLKPYGDLAVTAAMDEEKDDQNLTHG